MGVFRSLLIGLAWIAAAVCTICAVSSIGNFQLFLTFAFFGVVCCVSAYIFSQ